MASRSSTFHTSLHRPRLIMGVEKGIFAGLVLLGVFGLIAKAFWMFPSPILGYSSVVGCPSATTSMWRSF